jgi:hypothetical protein
VSFITAPWSLFPISIYLFFLTVHIFLYLLDILLMQKLDIINVFTILTFPLSKKKSLKKRQFNVSVDVPILVTMSP